MKLNELANKEIELYLQVQEIYDGKTKASNGLSLNQIYSEYRIIHGIYADLSTGNVEGLKRGLFLQWYARTEPNYLTGISELDGKAELKIITELKRRKDKNNMDEELAWMLDYYLSWSWVFERFKETAEFKKSKSTINFKQTEMKTDDRGQMGIYWNSIT